MVMEGSISTGNGKQNLTSISIFWKCYVGNSTDFQTWDLEKMESCFGNGKQSFHCISRSTRMQYAVSRLVESSESQYAAIRLVESSRMYYAANRLVESSKSEQVSRVQQQLLQSSKMNMVFCIKQFSHHTSQTSNGSSV